MPVSPSQMSETELGKLVEIAEAKMDPDLYLKVSYAFEKRGDTRKALFYWRKAEKCDSN